MTLTAPSITRTLWSAAPMSRLRRCSPTRSKSPSGAISTASPFTWTAPPLSASSRRGRPSLPIRSLFDPAACRWALSPARINARRIVCRTTVPASTSRSRISRPRTRCPSASTSSAIPSPRSPRIWKRSLLTSPALSLCNQNPRGL